MCHEVVTLEKHREHTFTTMANAKNPEFCETTILNYLMRTNRPYSVNDIHNNLQKTDGLTKASAQKAIDQLVIRQEIKEKVNGKSKVYFIDQDKLGSISPEEMKQLEDQINLLTQEIAAVTAELKPKEQQLALEKKGLSLAEIREQTAALDKENGELEQRLDKLRDAVNNVDPEEFKKIKTERKLLVGEWRKRKRMATDILDTLLEHLPKKKKELCEEIGIETDEDVNCQIPTLG